MRARRILRCLASFAEVAIFVLLSTAARAQQAPLAEHTAPASTSQFARRIPLNGVHNFAKVTPTLYRGAQPTPEGFRELQQLGIEIDVNLREGGEQSESEQRTVAALGMRYVDIPWSTFHHPKNEQVAEFLELVRANSGKKIFVHCREGADRTGVMVAAFRIADEHWSPQQAIQEMHTFHFHSFWLHSWKTYVQNFQQQFAADPSFQPLHMAAHTSGP